MGARTSSIAVAGALFSCIGAALAFAAWRALARMLAFRRGSLEARGVIVALRDERDGQETQRFQYPTVRFRTRDGRDATFESRVAMSGGAWRIGDAVDVRYRGDDPGSAEFDCALARWIAPAVLAFLAVVFLSVGAGLWRGLIAP